MHPKKIVQKIILVVLKLFPPSSVLKILFTLDQWLYYLQGQMAIAYGNGIHTKHRHIKYYDFFLSHIQPDERILDVDSNNGAVAYDIATKARATVVGMEINPKRVAYAQEIHTHPKDVSS